MVLGDGPEALALDNPAHIAKKADEPGRCPNRLLVGQVERDHAGKHDRGVNEKTDDAEQDHVQPEHAGRNNPDGGEGENQCL